ncbi:MAG: hypothetical protein HY646_12320 [Acidobacteria bacterium]|nr:hypothetical protein [Acidobacteriota bacterium]
MKAAKGIVALMVVGFCCINFAGCQAKEELPDLKYRIRESNLAQLRKDSELIVLGQTATVEYLGAIRNFENPPRAVRLQKVTLFVEYVLNGNATESLVFYRYAPVPSDLVKVPTPDRIFPLERSIFFLVHEGRFLRSAVDVTNSRVPIVSSIDLRGSGVPRNLPVEEQIAYLILTPGDDVDEEAFINRLRLNTSMIVEMMGLSRTLPFIKSLLKGPSEGISANACLILATYFWGHNECLERFVADSSLPANLRHSIATQQGLSEASEQRMLQSFLADSETWLAHYAEGEPRTCDLLVTLRDHPNPRVAQVARDTLLKRFPSFQTSGCPTLDP